MEKAMEAGLGLWIIFEFMNKTKDCIAESTNNIILKMMMIMTMRV